MRKPDNYKEVGDLSRVEFRLFVTRGYCPLVFGGPVEAKSLFCNKRDECIMPLIIGVRANNGSEAMELIKNNEPYKCLLGKPLDICSTVSLQLRAGEYWNEKY